MHGMLAGIIRLFYAFVHKVFPINDRVVFLSRQADGLTTDFILLRDTLAPLLSGWEFVEACHRKQTPSTVARDVFLVATSRVCILDGYNPAISVPNIDSQTLVVQMWHALGALKKFSWQAVKTAAGRSEKAAEKLNMHKNYSAIIAAGEGCISVFEEAFRYPKDKIYPLGMPRMDYLLGKQGEQACAQVCENLAERYPQFSAKKISVLYLPTHRTGESRDTDMSRYAHKLAKALPSSVYNVIFADHPFGCNKVSEVPDDSLIVVSNLHSIELLGIADYVITDYSAVMFEAALLHKKVIFYVPDLGEYRISPGLNIDPAILFSSVTFQSIEDVSACIEKNMSEEEYQDCGVWSFCSNYLVDPPVGATQRVADFIKCSII